MIRLILLGLLSAAFFSATFILNRFMSLSGGHWVWSSSLRFFYMFFLLVILITINRGADYLRTVITIFIKNYRFWLIAGSIGFGIFYSLLCYAADHAPGWVVAGTWQFTVIATSIFYKARNASKSPYIISAVDATQSGEVIFSLAGEMLLLNGALPNLTGGIGIIIIVVGIVGYSLRTG